MLLCVDFASRTVKVCGFQKEKRKFRVISSEEFPAEDAGARLSVYARGLSDSVSEIRVSATLDDTFHKTFLLPDLKKKTLKDALSAEVVKSCGADFLFKEKMLGQVVGLGGKVSRRLAAVGLKREALEQLSQLFSETGVKPSLYTTYPSAVQALLLGLGLLSEKPTAIMDLRYPTGRIVVLTDKEIRLTRELEVLDVEKDADRSGLAMDIYRTLLFYNENFPDEKVAKLIFGGEETTPEMEENLRKKTEAEVIAFSPEKLFTGSDQVGTVFPGCLGLAMAEPGEFEFEFVPLSVVERRQSKKRFSTSLAATLGVFLVLGLILTRFSLDLNQLTRYHGGVTGEIKMREDRLRELGLEFVSQSVELSQPAWTNILMEIAAVVPEGIALESCTLRKAKAAWQGEVTGTTVAPDEIKSLLLVEELQSNFLQSPMFKGAKLTEKELNGKQVAFRIIYQLNI